MEYLIGYKNKPESISKEGIVLFTNGTDTVQVNQITCEAYGYKYNAFNGSCEVKTTSNKLGKLESNKNNRVSGTNNKIESKTNNILINGKKKIAKGQNNNIL